MKRSLLLLILVCGLSFAQQGCKVRWVVKNTVPPTPTVAPTPIPFPNAWQIEFRVKKQIARLKSAMSDGTLDNETAYLLGQNDELIRQFSNEDRAPNQTVDLTPQQTADLNSMLDDNSYFIDDAIQHHQAWVLYFQTESYDYATSASPYLYLTSLDHQLRVQQGKIDAAVKDGRLTDTQAQELSNRIKIIKTAKRNYYRQNGHVDLSEDQVRQLSQMAQDSSQFLRFRLKGSHGKWNKEKFTSWTKQNNEGFGHDNGHHWGRKENQSNPLPTPTKPAIIAAVPTPVPTSVPTAIPTQPVVVIDPHHGHHWGNGKDKQDQPTPAPTATAVIAAVPTLVPTAVPTPKPQATVSTAPAPKLLPPGQLVQFLKRADQSVLMATKFNRVSEAQAKDLNEKLQALHQKADEDLKQNQANSVTQEQMTELAKMLAGINQTIQSNVQHGRPKPGNPASDRSNNSKKDEKEKAKNEDKKDTPHAADNTDNGKKGDKKDGENKKDKKDADATPSDKKAETPAADNSDSTKKDDGDKKDNGKGNDQR